MPTGHSGCMITGPFGFNGNFEIVFASPLGGLSHFWRDNDSPDLNWTGPELFGSGSVSAPSVLFNDVGALEAVVRAGDRLAAYRRTDRWSGPLWFGGNVTGNPAVVQSADGALTLVIPAVDGGFAQFARAADPEAPWEQVQHFGVQDGQAGSVALIQSSNLEAVAVMEAGLLAH